MSQAYGASGRDMPVGRAAGALRSTRRAARIGKRPSGGNALGRGLAALILCFACPCVAGTVTLCDATWHDASRGRDIPVRIRLPAGTGRSPIILFSHGLGGSLDSGTDWTSAWAEAGLATLTLEHPGSDRHVRASGINAAGLSEQLEARVADVRFVIDELGRRPREGRCDLQRMDLSRIGMSGHSFGAMTTEALSGQAYPLSLLAHSADPRIRASIAFSPSPPMRSRDDAAAFAGVRIPFMSITGTADFVPITPQITAADRQRPFRAMPPGDKYLLVVGGANHLQFNGQDGLGRDLAPDAHMRAIVVAATTAFWKATLSGDSSARRWLQDRSGLQGMLSSNDRFEYR